MDVNTRIDKFLWSVRIFKTRSIASEFCKNSRVTVDGEIVKPSKELKAGQIIGVKKTPIWHKFKVKDIPKSRLGAKLVEEYIEDVTPKEDLEYLEVLRLQHAETQFVDKGRPTKKQRRQLDDYMF
ncbi:MAG: RNA-binding S4 domain-containing protein [Luteibaculaceae bacterium]